MRRKQHEVRKIRSEYRAEKTLSLCVSESVSPFYVRLPAILQRGRTGCQLEVWFKERGLQLVTQRQSREDAGFSSPPENVLMTNDFLIQHINVIRKGDMPSQFLCYTSVETDGSRCFPAVWGEMLVKFLRWLSIVPAHVQVYSWIW